MSFNDYIQQYRLEMAKKMLLDTNLSLVPRLRSFVLGNGNITFIYIPCS
jgi:AraC-like DNA-binding protein